MEISLDKTDRNIINQLQYGFPICDHPFRKAAEQLNISEQELIKRIKILRENGILTRFGPLYHAENLGGALSLCAMKIPPAEFDRVAEQVNRFPEVAHNYQREHAMNMWFVLATESEAAKQNTLQQIEQQTGYPVYDMPKKKEYFVGLFLQV